jgi:hypothetical protein
MFLETPEDPAFSSFPGLNAAAFIRKVELTPLRESATVDLQVCGGGSSGHSLFVPNTQSYS